MMTGRWKEVTKLCFKGERFRGHALDLSALTELQQFQKMVAETAKALWRKANPGKRLPGHFEDRTRLCLRRIEEGSAVAPLEVFIKDQSPQGEIWDEPVEVKEAIDLAYRVFGAVHEDTSLPEEFPKELLDEYAQLGKGLSDDEVLEFAPSGKSATSVTARERERLTALAEPAYEDEVDIAGQVFEADIRQKKFQLWLNNGTSVHVPFTEEQEIKVTTALKDHKIAQLKVRGRGKFTAQGTLQRIIDVNGLDLVRNEDPAFDMTAIPIEDILANLTREVPDEEWNRLPRDLTDKLDHYLYGTLQE